MNFWQHRPEHGAPAIGEGERSGGVALDKTFDHHGGHGLASQASVQPNLRFRITPKCGPKRCGHSMQTGSVDARRADS